MFLQLGDAARDESLRELALPDADSGLGLRAKAREKCKWAPNGVSPSGGHFFDDEASGRPAGRWRQHVARLVQALRSGQGAARLEGLCWAVDTTSSTCTKCGDHLERRLEEAAAARRGRGNNSSSAPPLDEPRGPAIRCSPRATPSESCFLQVEDGIAASVSAGP